MSACDSFNQTSASYTFDYAREVAAAWASFSVARDKIVFLDLCATPLLVWPGEEGREAVERKVGVNGYLNATVFEYQQKKTSCCLPGLDARYLLLYTRAHKNGVLSASIPLAQELAFVFDHELAHVVAPYGMSHPANSSVPECVADAYAVIRHFQRFGADSAAIDTIVAARAFYMIFKKDREDHFTSPVTEALLERRHDIDWEKLTPAQVALMARNYALCHAMEERTRLALHDHFDRFHGKLDELLKGDDTHLRTLADMTLAYDFSNETKAGVAALKFAIDGNIPGLRLDDDYWQRLRPQIEAKHKAFSTQAYIRYDASVKETPSMFIDRAAGAGAWRNGPKWGRR